MTAPGPARSIAQRVDDALAASSRGERTPTALVLGKEDYPAFKAWAQDLLGLDIESDGYRGLPVRANEKIFLSRLMLQTKPGRPNALLL